MKTSLPASKTFHFIVLALILSVVLLLSVSTLLAAQVETPPSSESLVAPDAGRYFTLVTPGTANEVSSNATHDLMITATPTEVIGTWGMTGSMNVARGDLGGAVTLADGRVLVAAGSSATGPLGSAELYDPTTGVWTLTGSLNTARMWFGQPVLLADGRVLIAGGTDVSGYNDFASVEVYDRAAGTWSYTGSLNTPRRGARPIRLQDGRVVRPHERNMELHGQRACGP
ncbi:MAG: hypothetical protein IPO15_01560 [Anaerolineae bacterium]|uniref:hypothetical protein n=1 Tax=Candidatus Amarolinea dominans TaxID=3140696 RepID=UPI003137004F|nr:hypothetical protein [Anaerolineae bacterium]